MLIYFILLFAASIGMYFLQKMRKKTFTYKILYYILLGILILPAALRSSNVGTDSNNYVGSFHRLNITDENIFSDTKSFEIGYQLLEKIAKLISEKYWILFLLIAIVVIISYVKAIKTLSLNYAISIFIFISLGFYFFFFNGARQGIAAAIYSIAIIYMVKGDLKKYLLWVMIAFLFHKTVLFTIPFYYIFKLKHSLINIILAIAISMIVVLFSSYFLQLFPETFASRYSVYQDRGSSGATLLTIFFVSISVFYIIIRPFISKNSIINYDIYLNMTVLSAIIYLIVSVARQDVNMIRLTLYFSLGHVLIWPIIFHNVKFLSGLSIRLIFYIIFIAFFYIYINKMSNLVPYEFNPNLL